MDPKAKGEFLKKIAINGFSIFEDDGRLTLHPRGAEATAAVTIEEAEPDVWRVVSASGAYAGYARGKKRGYFETYLNQWAIQAVLQTEA